MFYLVKNFFQNIFIPNMLTKFFLIFFVLVGCSWLDSGGLVVAGWMGEGTTGKSVST